MNRDVLLLTLLVASVPASLCAQSARQPARAAPQPVADDETAVDEPVVTGQRPRGSVIGGVPPEQTFTPAEIRSFGVSSINDLLSELSPATESGRGGPPVVDFFFPCGPCLPWIDKA